MRGLLLIGLLIALAVVGYLGVKGGREHLEPTGSGIQATTEELRQEVERVTEERLKRLQDRDH